MARHHKSKKQSMRSRYHEHAGEERHLHGYHRGGSEVLHREHSKHHEGHYEGHEGRRHEEMADAGMIHEDRSQIANLPQNVMIKHYGDPEMYIPEIIDDTIRGIDHQIGADGSKRRAHFKPHKY